MGRIVRALVTVFILAGFAGRSTAQSFPVSLDPTRNLPTKPAEVRTVLPEQYIWTAGDVTVKRPDHGKFPWNRPDLRVSPHLFRAHFNVAKLPSEATLYLAGPREAHVFLNGRRVDDFYLNIDAPIGFHVFHASVKDTLRVGDNVLAIEAVRGKGVVSGTSPPATQQLAYGEVLAVKIVPAAFGIDTPALTFSNEGWRSVVKTDAIADTWSQPQFEDSSWPRVESLGPIESNPDFYQWSADAGMYGWPGYMGISSALRTFALRARAVTHVFAGAGTFANVESLTAGDPKAPFTVRYTAHPLGTDTDAPSLLLDFGREVAGRLLVESASSSDAVLSIAYGESELEAMATGLTPGQQGGNYLGTNILEVPANGSARGPKSGFRYVRIRFLRGAPEMAFKTIRVEGIYYPVEYAGSFESSDPLLNSIWETGAYTAHLCMQDGIWDAVKRDRGRWVGDLDVEGRVISTVFGNRALIEQTLRDLVPTGTGFVNGIPSYSALWVTSLESLYQHSGDKEFVTSQHDSLLRILAGMDASLDSTGLFQNERHRWLFVDWAPGLYAYTPEAKTGTQLQYVRGYRAAAVLLRAVGDEQNARRYDAQAEKTLAALRSHGVTYGPTWQLNALGVLVQNPGPNSPIWNEVLSHVKQDAPTDQVISPYFNEYVLDAMSALGHNRQALEWMKAYWGGMLAEGATSFWESYDLRWPKGNAHLSLQADGTAGFFVSMAHGWSSGPTAWLTENVLGITPASPGYATVNVRPDLMGLEFANGSVPTPHGAIRIRIDRQKGIELDIPQGITAANVRYRAQENQDVYVDGTRAAANNCTNGVCTFVITQPGHYVVGPH